MPVYEYQCPACATITEEIRSVAQRKIDLPVCTCGETTQLKISASLFILKGSGWSKDGYGGNDVTQNNPEPAS